jgi:carbon monoxide dehydrogenase subunit G
MQFEAIVHIAAPPDHVWRCVTDPTLVRGCIAGLASMEEIARDEVYRATVVLPLAQKQVACVADLRWLERHAPSRATLAVRVSLDGDAERSHAIATRSQLTLVNGTANRTQLQWHMEADLQGGLAGMPPQLLAPLLQRHSRVFFTCLKGAIEASQVAR